MGAGDARRPEPQADDPLVTVVVPTYRRPAQVERLLEALEKQTLPLDRFDVLVVDNDSPDDTSVRLAAFTERSPLHLQTLIETKRGPAATRNRGWVETRAPFVAFIDDDCVPEPEWLEAGLDSLWADERLGVVHGRTLKPPEAPLSDWTLWRHIDGPSPYFEACNIFYRRVALEQTGGFDEWIGNFGEDAALGWAVVDGGWDRGYVPEAVVYHDVEERGIRYHLRMGLREQNIVRVAKQHPGFRREAFWRPWVFRRERMYLAVAVGGMLLAPWRRRALLLAVPYLVFRMPSPRHPRFAGLFAERIIVDVARFVGMRIGSVRYRVAVI